MQSLQNLMQQLERSPQWQASAPFRTVLARWPQIVGAAVAQHSQPRKIQRGVLQVSVSSAAWAQTLTFERIRILHKLHQQVPAIAPEIKEMRFTTAQWRTTAAAPLRRTAHQAVEHPSWVRALPPPSPSSSQTVTTVFQHWSQHTRHRLSQQSLCPKCRRPCPDQELKRWSACAICMTHIWHQPPR